MIEMPEEDTEEDGEDVEEKLAAAEVGDFILAQELGRGKRRPSPWRPGEPRCSDSKR